MDGTEDNSRHEERAVELSTHVVDVEGPYGAVHWTPCKVLWDNLPHNKRAAATNVAGPRKIDPFFLELTTRLLRQVGKEDVDPASLRREWSLEGITLECCFGSVTWAFSEGLWEQIPADERESIEMMLKVRLHHFFREQVFRPLFVWAYGQ
jgi:hypothetical protein